MPWKAPYGCRSGWRNITWSGCRNQRRPIAIGIGLNTGPLILGIIGDGLRTDTGVVSDTVNTAARMEGLTKFYGASVIVSETTYNGMTDPNKFAHRYLDRVR